MRTVAAGALRAALLIAIALAVVAATAGEGAGFGSLLLGAAALAVAAALWALVDARRTPTRTVAARWGATALVTGVLAAAAASGRPPFDARAFVDAVTTLAPAVAVLVAFAALLGGAAGLGLRPAPSRP